MVWDGQEKGAGKRNPLMIASEHDHEACTKLLYNYGYRIPLVRGQGDSEGTQEVERSNEILLQLKDAHNDQVKAFLAFKAYCQPHYLALAFTEDERIQDDDKSVISEDVLLDLEKLDPLRRAFELAEQAENYVEANGAGFLKKHFIEVQKGLENFLSGLLTQCSDMDEVEVILDYRPSSAKSIGKGFLKSILHNYSQQSGNWQEPLNDGRKEFVSHPYFQRYFWMKMSGTTNSKTSGDGLLTKLTGEKRSARLSRVRWNCFYFPYALMLLFLYPFVIFIDFFRKADLLFVTPQEQKKQDMKEISNKGENKFFSFFRSTIHTPVFRMNMTHVALFIYICLVCVCVQTDTAERGGTSRIEEWYMVLTGIITLTFLAEDIKSLMSQGIKRFLKVFWNPFVLLTNLLLVIGGSIVVIYHFVKPDENVDRNKMSGNHPVNIGTTLMAIGAGLKVFQLLQVLLLFEYFGPFVLCVVSVFKDISKVAIIFVVVYAAFSLAAFTMVKPFQEAGESIHLNYTLRGDSPVASRRGLFMTMLWHLMDPGHPYQVYILNNQTGDATEEDFSLEFSHFMIIALWFVYDIIVVVLMLNILVAIMNTTYSKLWERANIEWNYNKTYYMVS